MQAPPAKKVLVALRPVCHSQYFRSLVARRGHAYEVTSFNIWNLVSSKANIKICLTKQILFPPPPPTPSSLPLSLACQKNRLVV